MYVHFTIDVGWTARAGVTRLGLSVSSSVFDRVVAWRQHLDRQRDLLVAGPAEGVVKAQDIGAGLGHHQRPNLGHQI